MKNMSKKLFDLIKETKKNSIKRSMLLSSICKPIGMLISFLYTPVLLAYLGEESYGIWATILSVINWINYFDVGIGLGLRNTLAKYVAYGNEKDANEAVSTGYVALSVISCVTFFIGSFFILAVNMGLVFNTKIGLKPALMVSFSCICLNFVLGVSRSLLYATQQAEKVSFMTVITQLINLLGILLLSFISHGSLLAVAIIIGISGIIVNIIFSLNLWKNFEYLIPHLSNFNKNKLKSICSLGLKFFLIQISALILYSTDNMIIIQLFGPASVTPYHTTYTAFGIIYGVFSAMIAPLWSQYTVAVHKGNYSWINKTIISFDKLLPFIAIFLIMGIIFFEPLAEIWLRRDLSYESGLISCMALYWFLQIWGAIYANVLNGMSHVNLQLFFAVFTATLNIPLSIFLGKNCELGTTGVVLATVLCMLVTNIPVSVYTHLFLNKQIKSENK